MSAYDPSILPAGLPIPEDDGAADHLAGLRLPRVRLSSTQGELDLEALAEDLLVLYVYPRTGSPGIEPPPGWDETPGARGCTPQSCGYRDHGDQLRELGARVVGLSAQPLEDQHEAAERLGLPHPVVADPEFRLAEALRLPTFEFDGRRLYKRLSLVAEAGRIAKVFYPVFPPDENAAEVVAWLREREDEAWISRYRRLADAVRSSE
jgi:peroxiredoxin